MKISVCSYSFNQYIKSGRLTQFDYIAKAKELGFDAIDFTELDAPDIKSQRELAKRLRDEADRLGIEIHAYAIGANLYREGWEECEREVERLCDQLQIASILGAKIMRHDVCSKLGKSGNGRSFGLMLPTIAENARRVADYGASLGIRTCTENHGFISQDSYRVEALFNAVAHDNFGVLVDIGNFLCVDEDPVSAVSRLAPYAVHVHVKDFKYTTEDDCAGKIYTRGANYIRATALGEGDVPVKQCIAILKRANYEGYLSLEYEGAEDCIAAITRGLANIRKIVG